MSSSSTSAEQAALSAAYDLVMLDLDGVVYIDGRAVAQAAESLTEARRAGLHLAFITNNAARPPEDVAAHLRELGIEAETGDVVTSSQAAARLLRDRFGDGASVAMLGASGLESALREAGLEAVTVYDEAVAVVTGYGPDVPWRDIMQAAVVIRAGLPWVATNTDATLPTSAGPAPGHGVLVELLSRFSGVEAVVAGKPQRPLFDETLRRVGGSRPLMVGDRLDTDISGARSAGIDSLLVMTGVTDLGLLVAATLEERPTHLSHDLSGLARPSVQAVSDGDAWTCGGWTSRVTDGRLVVDGSGAEDGWWNAAAAAGWAHLDEYGDPCDASGATPPERGISSR
jgi:glycerol 3-phosphatase-2